MCVTTAHAIAAPGLIYHPECRRHCFSCCNNNLFEITSKIDKHRHIDLLCIVLTAEGASCRHMHSAHPGVCLFFPQQAPPLRGSRAQVVSKDWTLYTKNSFLSFKTMIFALATEHQRESRQLWGSSWSQYAPELTVKMIYFYFTNSLRGWDIVSAWGQLVRYPSQLLPVTCGISPHLASNTTVMRNSCGTSCAPAVN